MHAPRKVMIVDDDEDVVASTRAMLRQHGYSVEGFTDSADALEEFTNNSNKYALVISDIRMPQIGGFELARSVREVRPDIAITLITSFDMSKSEFSVLFPSTPVADLVKKPISSAQLLSIVRKHVGMTEKH